MVRETKWTPQKRAAFLDVLANGGSATKAARAVNMARSYAYVLRDGDPAFRDEWDAAVVEGTETMEDEGVRRATEGVIKEKGVYHRGALVATEIVTEYSDTLLMFFLKGRKPDTYRDNASVRLGGDPDNPTPVLLRLYDGVNVPTADDGDD